MVNRWTEDMKCSTNFQKYSSSSTEIQRFWKTQAEKCKCKWSEKVVAEGTKVKKNVKYREEQ
jgi:hypothetical protein